MEGNLEASGAGLSCDPAIMHEDSDTGAVALALTHTHSPLAACVSRAKASLVMRRESKSWTLVMMMRGGRTTLMTDEGQRAREDERSREGERGGEGHR